MLLDKLVIIDSKYRDTTYSTSSADFTIGANVSYNIPPKKVRLKKLIIPFSFYVVNSYNNKLVVNIGALDIDVVLTNGNYDGTDFATELQSKLITATADATFTVVLDAATKKLTIARVGAFSMILTDSTINNVIGFGDADLTGAATYTATKILSLSTKYINIHSKGISREIGSYRSTSKVGRYIIETIPLNQNFGDNIVYENTNVEYYDFELLGDVDTFDFYLTDEYFNKIDLNGENWIVILEFV